jgi:hypothetical protein
MPTAEGVLPKVGNDPIYASEINRFAGASDYLYGINLSLSPGSSTNSGCWAVPSSNNLNYATDNNMNTSWAGSFIINYSAEGSIVFNLPQPLYKNRLLFAGSLTTDVTFQTGYFQCIATNTNGGSDIVFSTGNPADFNIIGSSFDLPKYFYPIQSITCKMYTGPTNNGSMVLLIKEMKLL